MDLYLFISLKLPVFLQFPKKYFFFVENYKILKKFINRTQIYFKMLCEM